MLLAACAEPTRGCDICWQSAIFYGIVTNDGGPAGGASVRAYLGSEPCTARAPEEAIRTVTDAAGRYRLQVNTPFLNTRCVQVEAVAPAGTQGRVDAPAVRFRATRPYDSVRVDVRLP